MNVDAVAAVLFTNGFSLTSQAFVSESKIPVLDIIMTSETFCTYRR